MAIEKGFRKKSLFCFLEIQSYGGNQVILKSTSTSLGVRAFFLRSGEGNEAMPHFPPQATPKF